MIRFLTTLVVCVLACSPALAQDKDPPTHKKGKKGAANATAGSFVVVDVSGELQLVDAKGLKAFKKQLTNDHKALLKSHATAKKEAKKAKEKFTDPKPKAPKVTVLSKKALPQAEAQAFLDKVAEERRKKAEKKGKKKGKSS